MEPVAWGFFGSISGTIIGAVVSIMTTTLNAKSSAKLQAATKNFDRLERANAFQRETLLKVQGQIHDNMRFMARAFMADREAFRRGVKWGSNSIPEDIDEGSRLAAVDLSTTIERISDESLRSEIKILRKEITNVYLSQSYEEAEIAHNNLSLTFEKVMEQVGKVLRSHY